MPHARQALSWLASAGVAWPGYRDNGASRACGDSRIRPPLGQTPLGQGVSQTEKALSSRNATHGPRLQSFEQDVESFLREMPVVREHIRETFAAYHLHGDTICQAIGLVGTRAVPRQSLQK